METKPDINTMLNIKEAGEYLGVTKHTLAWYRQKQEGPVYYKQGQAVLYKKDDLDEWKVRKGQQNIEVFYPKDHPLHPNNRLEAMR